MRERPLPVHARWLLAGLGSGFSPHAPGTMGSLACLLAIGAAYFSLGAAGLLWTAVGLGLAATAATLAWAERAIETPDGTGKKAHDPGWIVADEWAGQALAALGAWPTAVFAGMGKTVLALGCGFVLFRLFDVAKWGPIGAAERLPGALGIWLDDAVAGAAAGLLVAGAFAVA